MPVAGRVVPAGRGAVSCRLARTIAGAGGAFLVPSPGPVIVTLGLSVVQLIGRCLAARRRGRVNSFAPTRAKVDLCR